MYHRQRVATLALCTQIDLSMKITKGAIVRPLLKRAIMSQMKLQLDWTPVDTHEKLISHKIKRATKNPRPHTEISWRWESGFTWSIFVRSILTSFFKTPFQIPSEQKWTKQNRILLVKSSSTEVSCRSEVPRFVGEWLNIFWKPTGSQAGVRVLNNHVNQVLARRLSASKS